MNDRIVYDKSIDVKICFIKGMKWNTTAMLFLEAPAKFGFK